MAAEWRSSREARFRRIYEECAPKVRVYAMRRVESSVVADVVADTFLIVWRRLDDVPAGGGTVPWVYGVARRVVSDLYRSERRLDRLRARLIGVSGNLDSGGGGPDSDVEVEQALSRLSSRDREVLVLSYWDDQTVEETAGILGISPNAAAIRLHRARKRFAAAWETVERRTGRQLR